MKHHTEEAVVEVNAADHYGEFRPSVVRSFSAVKGFVRKEAPLTFPSSAVCLAFMRPLMAEMLSSRQHLCRCGSEGFPLGRGCKSVRFSTEPCLSGVSLTSTTVNYLVGRLRPGELDNIIDVIFGLHRNSNAATFGIFRCGIN